MCEESVSFSSSQGSRKARHLPTIIALLVQQVSSRVLTHSYYGSSSSLSHSSSLSLPCSSSPLTPPNLRNNHLGSIDPLPPIEIISYCSPFSLSYQSFPPPPYLALPSPHNHIRYHCLFPSYYLITCFLLWFAIYSLCCSCIISLSLLFSLCLSCNFQFNCFRQPCFHGLFLFSHYVSVSVFIFYSYLICT